jgi:hypothetical protein
MVGDSSTRPKRVLRAVNWVRPTVPSYVSLRATTTGPRYSSKLRVESKM